MLYTRVVLTAVSFAALVGVTTATSTFAAQTTGGKLAVSAAFTPSTLSTKSPATITIRVKDGSGRPVSGAVVKIATSMPSMSMKGANMLAQEHGSGTYTATAKLAYATKWAFDISADAKGQHGSTHVEKDLK